MKKLSIFEPQIEQHHAYKKKCKLIEETTDNCHLCLFLRKLPRPSIPELTTAPYDQTGSSFSADVLKSDTYVSSVPDFY